MATLKQAYTPEDIKSMGVANVRKAYNDLAINYNKIIDGNIFYCHKCNSFYSSEGFYNDKRFASGLFPICKKCLLDLAMDYDKKTKTYSDNREKTMRVFQMMDLPFIDAVYKRAQNDARDSVGERNPTTSYQSMLRQVKTLDQYKNLHWKDSEFDDTEENIENVQSNRKPRKEIKKIFGSGFTNDEYLYLQDQYDDWCARTQVDSKSQQLYVVRICFKLLDIWKAQQKGDDTTKLDDSLNKLMEAAKLQPKQNVSNAATDSLTFGQLIERWEENEPIPDPDPELADVDDIGKKLRVWFGGWLAHALGLNIPISKEYEEEVSKYSVEAPVEAEANNGSKLYKELFGGDSDE